MTDGPSRGERSLVTYVGGLAEGQVDVHHGHTRARRLRLGVADLQVHRGFDRAGHMVCAVSALTHPDSGGGGGGGVLVFN